MKLILNYKIPIFEDGLIKTFSIKNKYEINSNKKNKSGGDIFDNLENYILEANKNIEVKHDNENIKKHNIINNVNIPDEFTLLDLKRLIYYYFNIFIENQHIEILSNDSTYCGYEYVNNNINYIKLNTNINNIFSQIDKIEYIPVDYTLYVNRELYTVKNVHDYKLYDIDNKIIEVDIYNLVDFLHDANSIKRYIGNDNEKSDIFYYGFIEKYFPMNDNKSLSSLLNEKNIYEIYPMLKIKKDNIIKKIDKLNYLSTIKSKGVKPKSEIINVSIIVNNNLSTIINIKNIFNKIRLSNIIYKLEAVLFRNNEPIYLEKVKSSDNSNLELERYSPENDSILLYILIKGYEIKLMIDINNNIYIDFLLNETKKIEDYTLFIIKEIYNLITKINTTCNLNITLPTLLNTEVDYVSIDDIYSVILTKTNYNSLIDLLKEYEILDLYNINSIDEVKEIINIIPYIKIDPKDDVQNEFEYYLNNKLGSTLLNKSGNIKILSRINDFKISFIDISLEDYFMYKNLFEKIIYIFSLKKKTIKNVISLSSMSKIKFLKENDPVLFNMDKETRYSRKCQYKQQPIVIPKDQIKKHKNYIKYWNFTKGSPEYYSCDNKNYPYVKFLTEIHPKNFCLPCCKKKSTEDIKTVSSYADKHEKCLSNFIYDKNNKDTTSRYVSNYSCKINIEDNRLMDLSLTMKKIINSVYDDDNYKYFITGVKTKYINFNNIPSVYIYSKITKKTPFDIINSVSNFFKLNSLKFTTILNGELPIYFSNIKELLLDINQLLSPKSIYISNFIKWDALFSEVFIYFGYKFINIYETDNDTINDSNISIQLDNNLYNYNEFIQDLDQINYVIIVNRLINNILTRYPIFKLDNKEYYNDKIIYKPIFKYNDSIILRIKKIITSSIVDKTSSISSLTINTILSFLTINKKYNLKKYYVNNNTYIYAILLEYNNNLIYLNIHKTKPIDIPISDINNSKLYSNIYSNINKLDLKINTLFKFLEDYNNYIYKINNNSKQELVDIFQIIKYSDIKNTTINFPNIDKYNRYNYCYITKFILFNNEIIGGLINDMPFYINKTNIKIITDHIQTSHNKVCKYINKKDIQKILTRTIKLNNENNVNRISITNVYSDYFIEYMFNPVNINLSINENLNIKDKRIKEFNKSLYITNLYNILLSTLSVKINNLRDGDTRNKIKFIISNSTESQLKKISDDKRLKKILDNNYETYNKLITSITDINKKYKNSKKNILNFIDNTEFSIDKKYISKFVNLDYINLKNKIIKLLEKDIVHKKLNNNNEIDIDLNGCSGIKKSYYCDNNKIIIDNKIYKYMLEILTYDISNPFKRNYILEYMNIKELNLQFDNIINEKIYIYR